MWYKDILSEMVSKREYSRMDIYNLLKNTKPDLTFNSFKWILSDMVSEGVIARKGRGIYVIEEKCSLKKTKYRPAYNENGRILIENLERKFPLVDFVCFESVQLNEFLNHLIAQNTYFLMVEKDAVDFVFRYLQDEEIGNVLLRPDNREWESYWTKDSIVLLNLVSEAPSKQSSHEMSLEQLLVDIVAEKSFRLLYSSGEIERIYEGAIERYQLDTVRMLRYARRRGKAELVSQYLGE